MARKAPLWRGVKIECKDGWRDLLVGMKEKLKDRRARGLKILRIRERSGMLCVHYSFTVTRHWHWASDTIYDFEKMSLFICEQCGEWRSKGEIMEALQNSGVYLCRACGHSIRPSFRQQGALTS